MVLPSFASALAALVTLMFLFRNRPNPIGEPSKGKSSASKMTGTLSRITRSIPGASHLRKRRQLANASPPGDHSGREGRDHEDGVAQHPTIFIPPSMIRPDVDPRAALVDPKGAIFNSVIMAATLVLLVATSVIGGVKVSAAALDWCCS